MRSHILKFRKGYHRTVLIFCPDKDVFGKCNIPKYISKILSKGESSEPKPKERRLANRLIAEFVADKVQKADKKLAIAALIQAATRWADSNLWARAMSACPPDLILQSASTQGILEAYQVLGFRPLETSFVQSISYVVIYLTSLFSSLTTALSEDVSNSRRIGIIQELKRLGKEKNDERLLGWCSSQQGLVLGTLRKGVEQDVDCLVSLVKRRKIKVLNEMFVINFFSSSINILHKIHSIFPQLLDAKSDVSFWIAFLQELVHKQAAISPTPDRVQAVVRDQVSKIISNAPPFPGSKATIYDGYYGAKKLKPQLDKWILYIKLCMLLNCPDSCTIYFQKMIDGYDQEPQQTKETIADHFIPPAITKLDEEAQALGPDTISLAVKFFVFALGVYVDRTVTQCKGEFVARTFRIAANRAGGPEVLKATYAFYSKMWSMDFSLTISNQAKSCL